VRCSNPVQCQLAKREFCRCACGGEFHAILRKELDNPETAVAAQEKLVTLKAEQVAVKRIRRLERRAKRALVKKASNGINLQSDPDKQEPS